MKYNLGNTKKNVKIFMAEIIYLRPFILLLWRIIKEKDFCF